MTLKTFNVDEKIYDEYSSYCKKQGISMSKRVEGFIRGEVEKLKSRKSIVEDKDKNKVQISEQEHSFRKYC